MMLELRDIGVEYDGKPFLRGVNLAVERGERVSLVGPSGSGKSTLLRVIAGIERPSTGEVIINGEDVTSTPPHLRQVGMVFQDNQLFPHLTVGDNVGYSLRVTRRRDRAEVVREMLDLVGLAGFTQRAVTSLSGGEQKRVAVARSLAANPTVLLLDEPLTGLDEALHDRLLDDLIALFDRRGTTVVHVTHDMAEAHRLSSRVIEISELVS
ncbi:MAG: Sulfate/thiosulfate import ATP-binding protein CysA [Actinomycetota bacterium]